MISLDQIKVAIIMGGISAEREVSLRSGAAVLQAFNNLNINAFTVDGTKSLLETDKNDYDVVFNILHGEAGENGELAGLLACLDVPFTGTKTEGAVLSWDKNVAKTLVKEQGLKTPRACVVTPTNKFNKHSVGSGPWIVKPTQEGSSVGLFYANTETELHTSISKALELVDSILIEDFIDGIECTVAIVAGNTLPVIKIQPAIGMYDYQAKYENDDTQYFCPSGFDDTLESALKHDAEVAFKALSLKGWGRIDFIIDTQGNRWFLEANTTPGMTATSLVPKAAATFGWDFNELVKNILLTSMQGEENVKRR
jgi:D-alanine-D-alanine ligase